MFQEQKKLMPVHKFLMPVHKCIRGMTTLNFGPCEAKTLSLLLFGDTISNQQEVRTQNWDSGP